MTETSETWYTHSSIGDTLSDIIKLCFHGNTVFSSPPGCFQYFGEFHPRKNKPGQVVHLKHISMLARSGKKGISEKYQNGTPKEARKAFNIGEVWNPVCCHGDTIDYLIL